MVHTLKRVSTYLYKQFVQVPTIVSGRWRLDDSHVAMRKSDWSTEDHCGCDEMRMKYLYEKEKLENLIDTYHTLECNANTNNEKSENN